MNVVFFELVNSTAVTIIFNKLYLCFFIKCDFQKANKTQLQG